MNTTNRLRIIAVLATIAVMAFACIAPPAEAQSVATRRSARATATLDTRTTRFVRITATPDTRTTRFVRQRPTPQPSPSTR